MQKLWHAVQDWWDAILALAGAATSAYNIIEQLIQFGAVKNSSIWPVGILIFLMFGSIALVRSRWEANRYKREKPILRVVNFGDEEKPLYREFHSRSLGGGPEIMQGSMTITTKYHSLFIEIFNTQKVSIAERVWANIEWMNEAGKSLFSHQGRWHIASPNTEGKKEELQFVDFDSNGHPRKLHFASVNLSRQDKFFYGLGREMDGKESWDNPKYRLDGEHYIVKITLRGNNGVKQEFKYSVRNDNGKISIVKALTNESEIVSAR